MDRNDEVNKELAAEKDWQPRRAVGGLGIAAEQTGQAQMYSPRLGVLRQIDEATDDLLARVAKLREFRKSIERGSDREANLVEQAIQLLHIK